MATSTLDAEKIQEILKNSGLKQLKRISIGEIILCFFIEFFLLTLKRKNQKQIENNLTNARSGNGFQHGNKF